MWRDARKIFVNPEKRIVKFDFVTFWPMGAEWREVVHGERGEGGWEVGGGTRPEIGFQIGLGRGKHKTDILSDVKLFRVFCLKLAGVVFGDLALPMK